jgi:hypothetical protein
MARLIFSATGSRGSGIARIFALAIVLSGCATLGAKTEGVSGPIEWRVTDLSTTTREVNGRPVDARTFTLVLKNASSERITLLGLDETRFQPGASPGYSKRSGEWVIEPGREWRLQRSYSLVCNSERCTDTTLAQPMFRIKLKGTKQSGGDVEETLDITLPAQGMGRPPAMR